MCVSLLIPVCAVASKAAPSDLPHRLAGDSVFVVTKLFQRYASRIHEQVTDVLSNIRCHPHVYSPSGAARFSQRLRLTSHTPGMSTHFSYAGCVS